MQLLVFGWRCEEIQYDRGVRYRREIRDIYVIGRWSCGYRGVRLLPEKGKASFINEAAANTVYDIHAAQNYLSTFLRN
jgi:hypothetical protein